MYELRNKIASVCFDISIVCAAFVLGILATGVAVEFIERRRANDEATLLHDRTDHATRLPREN